ncbi:MAG: hypothetical protein AB7P99_19700 [Vicinamibacterales bacterium]
MADDAADVVRRSLDAVDRHRKRMMLVLGAVAVLLVVTAALSLHLPGRTSQVNAVMAHFAMLLAWVTTLAFAIMVQISAMTRRILQAIDAAARR